MRYIYDMYAATHNLSDVARLCNEHGKRGKRGKPFTAFSIYTILTNPIYCGYKVVEGVLEEHYNAVIIDRKQFNSVQISLLDASKHAGRGRKDNTVCNIPAKEKTRRRK